ncbi:TetR family transcriptional regulator [Stella humosa]|uniref:TetR family transcriptional regulator n=1 Tax=Stella humosa TaxID=94 RepID=A0A3N1L0V7_9PROT|nr:TetR/AcrR family transcriptional regulator [Stella humosa]ROP84238.1 TetR family transcriptional regulator [Stella humosa]BBK33750.1 TetR family transcriptional regulator [Stella humosa]
MRVTKEQAARNRDRIVEVAGELFRRHGFDGIGIADVMKAAGLTHGGFYGHFASKEDLAAQASAAALEAGRARWQRLGEKAGDGAFSAFVERYLSPIHRDAPERGCVLAALGAESARQPGPVRDAAASGIDRLADVVAGMLPAAAPAERRRHALAVLAQMVGAMVLARAAGDSELSDEILAAARAALEPQADRA